MTEEESAISRAEFLRLKNELQALQEELALTTSRMAKWAIHGANELFTGHGTQRFGDNTGRLDRNGIQLLGGTVEAPIGYRLVSEFIVDASASGPYGYSILGKLASTTDMSATEGISNDLDNLTTATDVVATIKSIGAASSELTLKAKDSTDTALVALLASTSLDVRRLYLTDTSLGLAQVAADSGVGTTNDGSLWYNTTTNKIRATVNGSNVDVATGSAGWSPIATTKTTTYTAVDGDFVICNSASAFTVTLPLATTANRRVVVKNINTGLITVDGNGSETIDNAASITLLQYDSVTLFSDGTEWWIV